MHEKDRAAMERYFDKNLIFTHMSGKKQTREEFIGEIMDGTLNYFKVDTKDYSISVNGDTANFSITVLGST
ncbi:MAG: nuclear transport factor 2 family protein [Treponema sp.]|nr:nuclear transport factor 2 family protein [Treponema sp.]